MAEPLRDDGHIDAGGEHERRLTVAQIVQTDAAQAPAVDVREVRVVIEPDGGDQLGEQLCDVVGP